VLKVGSNADPFSRMSGFRLKHGRFRAACVRVLQRGGNKPLTAASLRDRATNLTGTPFSMKMIPVDAVISNVLKRDLRFEKVGMVSVGHGCMLLEWKLTQEGLDDRQY